MNEKQQTHLSKFISLILRHDPKKINIQLDQMVGQRLMN